MGQWNMTMDCLAAQVESVQSSDVKMPEFCWAVGKKPGKDIGVDTEDT